MDGRSLFLLYGVTASGKTEVYMEAIDKVLGKGKTAHVGAGNISTKQIIREFAGRSSAKISLPLCTAGLHSGNDMTNGRG